MALSRRGEPRSLDMEPRAAKPTQRTYAYAPSPTPPPLNLADPPQVAHPHMLDSDSLTNIQHHLPDASPDQLRSYINELLLHVFASRDVYLEDRQSLIQKINVLSDRVASLAAQITTLPSLYALQASTELERMHTENELLRRECRALLKKLSSRSMIYIDAEHEQEIRILQNDKEYLERRLKDSENNAANMETQLLKLRSILINNSPLIIQDKEFSSSSLEKDGHTFEYPTIIDEALPINRTYEEPPKSRYKAPTMGDAEAEHLLLAGKRLGLIRRIIRKPLKRPKFETHPSQSQSTHQSKFTHNVNVSPRGRRTDTAVNSPSTPDGYGGMDELLQAAQTVLTRPTTPQNTSPPTKRSSPSPKRRKMSNMPGITMKPLGDPLKEAFSTFKGRATFPENVHRSPSPVRRSGENIPNGETSRETTPLPEPSKADSIFLNASPKTPKQKAREIDLQESPNTKRARILSGLDVLADQATASQESADQENDTTSSNSPSDTPSPSSKPNETASKSNIFVYTTEREVDQYKDDFGKPAPNRSYSVPNSRTQFPNLSPENNQIALPPPTNPPQFQTYSRHSSNSSPASPRKPGQAELEEAGAKKGRSPYIKWNLAEDEMLVKAVIEWGLRWDQVSRLVPVRSYHQCRQRWIRGLKGGEQLPEELKEYAPEVQRALKRYHATRRPRYNTTNENNHELSSLTPSNIIEEDDSINPSTPTIDTNHVDETLSKTPIVS